MDLESAWKRLKIVRLLKKERPDHHYIEKVFEHVRDELDLRGGSAASKKLPELLTDKEVSQFYDAVFHSNRFRQKLMITAGYGAAL